MIVATMNALSVPSYTDLESLPSCGSVHKLGSFSVHGEVRPCGDRSSRMRLNECPSISAIKECPRCCATARMNIPSVNTLRRGAGVRR